MDTEIILYCEGKPYKKVKVEERQMSNKEKVTAERDDLAGKIKRLKVFMKTDTFKQLDKDDQMVMKEQKDAMKMYKRALDLRLYWEIY